MGKLLNISQGSTYYVILHNLAIFLKHDFTRNLILIWKTKEKTWKFWNLLELFAKLFINLKFETFVWSS